MIDLLDSLGLRAHASSDAQEMLKFEIIRSYWKLRLLFFNLWGALSLKSRYLEPFSNCLLAKKTHSTVHRHKGVLANQ